MMKISKTNGAEYAPLGIYVHIPFCVRKCKYCDFVSYEGKSLAEQQSYVNSVCKEIEDKAKLYDNKYIVDTVFVGGGTPTVLKADDLARILKAIKTNFKCELVEASFEANPGTITKEKLLELKDAGFNRISIGVQSFNDDILNSLGRIHDSNEATAAVRLALECGFNTNLDLMFGVPGQTIEIWKNTLTKAIKLNPNHISFYSLQLEEGTPLYENYRYGNLELPSWEENRKMYHMALDMLKDAGYHHYEISNASKPGFECRHNLKYWNLDEYLGIGEAAHSYINGKRTGEDVSDPKGDFIFTKLRLIEGFDKSEYQDRFDISFEDEFKDSYKSLLVDGLLVEKNGRIMFTKKGLDYTNPVMQSLLLCFNNLFN